MPTITIYVSDEVRESIEKWRDQLNLSELARRAIMAEIEKLERLPEVNDDDLEALIARLREQKEQMKSRSYLHGYELGSQLFMLEDAFRYADFVDLERRMENNPHPESYLEWLPEWTENALFNEDWIATRLDDGTEVSMADAAQLDGDDLEEWIHGFCSAALQAWKRIKEKI